jgi:hypothetical protein
MGAEPSQQKRYIAAVLAALIVLLFAGLLLGGPSLPA